MLLDRLMIDQIKTQPSGIPTGIRMPVQNSGLEALGSNNPENAQTNTDVKVGLLDDVL